MPIDLTARTPAGAALLALADRLAADLATRAPAHDRDGSYPFQSIDALREAGYLAAPVPAELGGLGVESVHDLVVASARLARGDASVAIGVNMHLHVAFGIARRRRMAAASGDARRTAAFDASLADIARGETVIATAVSEPGQDLTRPSTRATPTTAGWRIDGRKVFCTMSPAATLLLAAVTYRHDDGGERYGYAQVPADTPGVVVHGDWDALGMRASGSHSVTFDGVEVPRAALRGGFATGDPVPYIERSLGAGLFHASASLGIAEAATVGVTRAIAARGGSQDARTRMLAAESAMDLAACRAVLARAATLLDEHYEAHPQSSGSEAAIVDLFSEEQAAKTLVNEGAARIVDRALALSGGAGYANSHPLSRAYRDVRAGAFMHPLGANRAYEFIGRRSLGEAPALH
jgi:alkylation response protein AidB-like acyl-CoA dehydrogenase